MRKASKNTPGAWLQEHALEFAKDIKIEFKGSNR